MRGRWLSDDPDIARSERFFLLYSPVWMAVVAVVMLSGALGRWGDPEYLAFGLGIAAPLVVGPALRGRGPWRARYGLRFNLWIALFVFAGSYAFTHYFFDVLGMRYAFPCRWVLDAVLVGRDSGEVPIFLYPLTQCYFVTYFTVMLVVLRRLRTGPLAGVRGQRVLDALALVALAYATAFAETFVMTREALSDYYWFVDRGRMLAVGSLFYATYFVIGVPFCARVGAAGARRPSLGGVAVSALAASMLVFYALDLWALVFGPLVEG